MSSINSIRIGGGDRTPIRQIANSKPLTENEKGLLSKVSNGAWNDNYSGNYNIPYLLKAASCLTAVTDIMTDYTNNKVGGIFQRLVEVEKDARSFEVFHLKSGLWHVDLEKIAEQTKAVEELQKAINNTQNDMKEGDGGILSKIANLSLVGGAIGRLFEGVGSSSFDAVKIEEQMKGLKEAFNAKAEEIRAIQQQIGDENARVRDSIDQNVRSSEFIKNHMIPYFNTISEEKLNILASRGVDVANDRNCQSFRTAFETVVKEINNVGINASNTDTAVDKENSHINGLINHLLDQMKNYNQDFDNKLGETRQAALAVTITEIQKSVAFAAEAHDQLTQQLKEGTVQNLTDLVTLNQRQLQREKDKPKEEEAFNKEVEAKLTAINHLSQEQLAIRLEHAETHTRELVQRLSDTENEPYSDPVAVALHGNGNQ